MRQVNQPIEIDGKVIDPVKARKLKALLKAKASACENKLNKIENRIKVLDRFLDEKTENTTLVDYLAKRNLKLNDIFSSIGYYTTKGLVASADGENDVLEYYKPLEYSTEFQVYLPTREVVSDLDHRIVTESKLGYTYNPNLAQYFPTTIYDTNLYTSAEEMGDNALDIMGGFSMRDLAVLTNKEANSRELTENVKELLEEEYDLVEAEYDNVSTLLDQFFMQENYSGAEGSKAGRNALCRSGCATKHPFNKSKREACQKECDKKFPPSDKQEDRRENREARQDARQEKREDKRDCKAKYKAGELTKAQYEACKKAAREEKREKIKASGGNFFVRAARGVAKVFPFTLAARAGVLVLTELNAFGFATRLAPAVLPVNEASSKFKPTSIVKAKKGWEKVSKAYKNMGGDPSNLEKAILKGYRKKPMVVKEETKSGISGYEFEVFSGAAGTIATTIVVGLGALVGLIEAINKAMVDRNPYKDGMTPSDYLNAEQEGALDPPSPDPLAPVFDADKNEWVDPSNGRPIDPMTGKYKDLILGMHPWLAAGVGLTVLGLTVYLFTRKK
jgi:hypothetical protein